MKDEITLINPSPLRKKYKGFDLEFSGDQWVISAAGSLVGFAPDIKSAKKKVDETVQLQGDMKKFSAIKNPRSFPNIEKSGFHKGEYVGYGGGNTWRIKKSNGAKSRWWMAIQQNGKGVMHANLLSKMSEQLSALDISKNPARRKGTKIPLRKSQITKKKPTPRLVKRRKTNSKKGYFPNPSLAHALQKATGPETVELSEWLFLVVKKHGQVNVTILHDGILDFIHSKIVLAENYTV